MELFPIRTKKIVAGDDLVSVLRGGEKTTDFLPQDILVISSKAVATAEGRIIKIGSMKPSAEALALAQESELSEEFCEAVLQECAMWNGRVVHTCPGAILTELRPSQHDTSILIANAGLDQSNVGEGYAVGWPLDPAESAGKLRRELECAVIISDSCCTPRRQGVTAFALAVSGLDPIRSEIGSVDLFGKKLRMTNEAVADQLSTAANFLMGNAGQSVPTVIVRGHNLKLSEFEGWVPGIQPGEDLFPLS